VFLHLRLFDERKDFEHDKRHNPDRPLPRGLVTLKELRIAWVLAIVTELALSAWLGIEALIAMTVVVAYSIVMLNEFWIGGWMRPRLYTYAVTHTLITPLMLLFVMSAETNRMFWDPPAGFILFALAGWPLFLVFEVARKTYAPPEEPEGVNTYSSLHSPQIAAGLIVVQGVVSVALVGGAMAASPTALAICSVVALGLLGFSVPYARSPTLENAKRLRGGATFFLMTVLSVPSLVGFVWFLLRLSLRPIQ
jgi:4-hydroxybenzoate polyprenyltransferase